MTHLNVEIKACCRNPDKVRLRLKGKAALFKGVDNQTDTYFNTPRGRLKLREGNIEFNLIHYDRENEPGPKDSNVTLYQPERDSSLKDLLTKALGILVVVRKRREIYFIDNVKFHIDEVENLGSFIEIEAIDMTGAIGRERLLEQCRGYMEFLGVEDSDLISGSYSDMLLSSKIPFATEGTEDTEGLYSNSDK